MFTYSVHLPTLSAKYADKKNTKNSNFRNNLTDSKKPQRLVLAKFESIPVTIYLVPPG